MNWFTYYTDSSTNFSLEYCVQLQVFISFISWSETYFQNTKKKILELVGMHRKIRRFEPDAESYSLPKLAQLLYLQARLNNTIINVTIKLKRNKW